MSFPQKLDKAARQDIARAILPQTMLESDHFARFAHKYNNVEAAIDGIVTTRKRLIPRMKRGNSIADVDRDGGSNCIAFALAGCALGMLVEKPVLNTVFVMRAANAHMLIGAAKSKEGDPVYRVDYYTKPGEEPYVTDLAEDMLIFRNHRMPGTRLFTETALPEHELHPLSRILTPYISAGEQIVDRVLGVESLRDYYSEYGFPEAQAKFTQPTLSVSGVSLVAMDRAVKEWYALKRQWGGPWATAALNDKTKSALPFEV